MFSFAGAILEEYERKGYDTGMLFMALVTLIAQDDYKKAGNALCHLDRVVSDAVSIAHE